MLVILYNLYRTYSEIHGNMYLESCEDMSCEHMHYRCFDVTEKTNIKRHKTGRNCSKCQKPLSDTIVHFGEMNRFNHPYRWESGINLNLCIYQDWYAFSCKIFPPLEMNFPILRFKKRN